MQTGKKRKRVNFHLHEARSWNEVSEGRAVYFRAHHAIVFIRVGRALSRIFFYQSLSVNLILPRPLGREIRKARTVRLIKLRSTLRVSCFFSFSSFFSPVFSLPLYTLHSRVGSPRLFSGPSFLLRSAPFFICVEIHPSFS